MTSRKQQMISTLNLELMNQKHSVYLFLAICLDLVVAPMVYAASASEFSRTQAWALGLLGLGTVALSAYLFFVIFIPEKF